MTWSERLKCLWNDTIKWAGGGGRGGGSCLVTFVAVERDVRLLKIRIF